MGFIWGGRTQEGKVFPKDSLHPWGMWSNLGKSRKGQPPTPFPISGSLPNAKFLLWNLNPSSIFLTVVIVSTEGMSDSMRLTEAEGDWEWWGPAKV